MNISELDDSGINIKIVSGNEDDGYELLATCRDSEKQEVAQAVANKIQEGVIIVEFLAQTTVTPTP